MIDVILSRYKKLKTREKILTIVFTAVIATSLYHRFLYKPLTGDVATYEFQVQKLTTRLNELNAQYPELNKQQEKIKLAARGNEEISKKIIEIEKKLPSARDASRLTAELTRLAKGLELVSVQQKIDKGELYSRIFVELRFNAPFNAIVDYTDRIEGISPFFKVEELNISEPTGKSKGPGLQSTLLVSCLLREADHPGLSLDEGIKEVEIPKEAVSKARDIFASQARPAVTVKAKERRKLDFKLEGITFSLVAPTAIINDDVVRVGSEIDGFKVKEIGPNNVILTDGTEEFSLTMEK